MPSTRPICGRCSRNDFCRCVLVSISRTAPSIRSGNPWAAPERPLRSQRSIRVPLCSYSRRSPAQTATRPSPTQSSSAAHFAKTKQSTFATTAPASPAARSPNLTSATPLGFVLRTVSRADTTLASGSFRSTSAEPYSNATISGAVAAVARARRSTTYAEAATTFRTFNSSCSPCHREKTIAWPCSSHPLPARSDMTVAQRSQATP